MNRTTIALAAAGAAFALAAGSAQAATVSCGQVITQSTVVDNDLVDCPGSGLVVGASGITITIAGRTIDGTGSARGIDNSGGFDNVVVSGGAVGGTVKQFNAGGYSNGADGGQWLNVTSRDHTGFAFEIVNAVGVKLDESEGMSSVSGFDAVNVQNAYVDRGAFNDNLIVGVDFNGSNTHATVTRTVASGNDIAGVTFQNGSHDGLVDQVRANDNGGFPNCQCGILVRSQRVTITRSEASGNIGPGIFVGFESAQSRVERSIASSNGGTGIEVVPGIGATVARNTAMWNGGWGMFVGAGNVDGGRNRASGNAAGQCSGVSCTA